MPEAIRWLLQLVCYGLFALLLGYYSANPAYQHHDPDQALIKLSFSHAGEHVSECMPMVPELNLNKAPNMQIPMKCPRGRISLVVEVELDGELLYQGRLPPTGLAGDGESTVYQRFIVAPGSHVLSARLRDTRREQGFDHEHTERIDLSAGQNFVIDFSLARGGFDFL